MRIINNGSVRLSVLVDNCGSTYKDTGGRSRCVRTTGDECCGAPLDSSSSRTRESGRRV